MQLYDLQMKVSRKVILLFNVHRIFNLYNMMIVIFFHCFVQLEDKTPPPRFPQYLKASLMKNKYINYITTFISC